MRRERLQSLGWTVTVLALAGALGACEEAAGPELVNDKPVIEVGAELVVQGLPTATFQNTFGVVDLDTTGDRKFDLFDRSIPTLPLWDSPRYGQTFELATDFGRKSVWAPRLHLPGQIADDPRKPFLVENTNWGDNYVSNMDQIRVRGPKSGVGGACPSGPCWTIQTDLDFIGPNDHWMAMGFVRYGVKVNGLEDHLEVWVRGQVVEPDSLVPLPWNPGGYPEHQADYWQYNADGCADAQADANPFVFGHFKTGAPTGVTDPKDPGANYDGETDADWCFNSAGVWDDDYTGKGPLAPNTFESFDLPQYNYFVIWDFDKETNTVRYDRPYVRAQVGVDLDLNGNPIPHAFAPFPYRAGHEYSEFSSREEFLADPRVAAGAASSTVTVLGLPAFGGLEYQVWLYHQITGATAHVPVLWAQQRPDTVGFDELGDPIIEWVDLAAPATVPSFPSQGRSLRHVITVEEETLAGLGEAMSGYTHLVVTLGKPGAEADPTSSAAILSFRYTEPSGTPDDFFDDIATGSGDALFAFVPGDVAAAGKSWQWFGGGSVHYNGSQAFGLILNRIARPPVGWYYGVWLLAEADDGSVTRELELGEITTPAPEFASLRDADVTTGALVTEREILKAAKWVEASKVNITSLNEFTRVVVTLQPKDGAAGDRSPIQIFSAQIPPDLDKLKFNP